MEGLIRIPQYMKEKINKMEECKMKFGDRGKSDSRGRKIGIFLW